jgi:hypothetical protein
MARTSCVTSRCSLASFPARAASIGTTSIIPIACAINRKNSLDKSNTLFPAADGIRLG